MDTMLKIPAVGWLVLDEVALGVELLLEDEGDGLGLDLAPSLLTGDAPPRLPRNGTRVPIKRGEC